MEILPLLLGLIAGGTVIVGALPIMKIKISKEKTAYLALLAAGILAYIALDTGSAAGETLEHLLEEKHWTEFTVGIITTSIALLGTWVILALFDKEKGPSVATQNTPLILATALGVHNVAEGFAIAAALLAGAVGSAITFTIAFGIHNATEGIAIASPGRLTHSKWLTVKNIVLLSLIAGLPVSLGSAVYYIGFENELFFANLNTIASAALVYPMIRVNLIGASLLGGFNIKFWTWFFLGVAIAFGLESLVIASLS
jgi:ZIP family zinc transporter